MKAFLLLFLSAVSFGADGNPDNWCREGHFAKYGGFRLGEIKTRVYFYGDDGECPKADNAKCKTKKYLVPGDEVLVAHSYGGFICAWFQPSNLKKKSSLGWIAESAVTVKEAKATDFDGWIGTWQDDTSDFVIKKGKDGKLVVNGTAQWDGGNGNVHVGEVKAEAAPTENKLLLKEESCEVKAERYGKYLIASDNRECGGVNVAFDGVYLRTKK